MSNTLGTRLNSVGQASAVPTAAPEEVREVALAALRLENNVEELLKRVEKLSTRLEPIMTPPTPSGQESSAQIGVSAFGERIIKCSNKVASIALYITELETRVQI